AVLPTLEYTYNVVGFYEPTLRVTDDKGSADTSTWYVAVPQAGNAAPSASFTKDSAGGEVPVSINFDASASLDFDGDGVSEIVVAEPQTSKIIVLNSYNTTGALQASDADSTITGSSDGLGNALGGADVDGDGYDDLVTCALWDNNYTGAAYLIHGVDLIGVTDSIGNVAAVRFIGAAEDDLYCYGAHPQVADMNGDGATDLMIGTPQIATVYLYADLPSLTGIVDTLAATEQYTSGTTNAFGWAMEQADVDGDGLPELLIGEPDTGFYSASTVSYAWIFTDVGNGTSQTTADALFSFTAATGADNLGYDVLVRDLDGNGTWEVPIAAPGDDGSYSYTGRLWIPEL
ncbi:MAG TPA: VCBS repeat-containing protein, partial [Myxococcota bacterium]|nr:VCBS repeat-containing protein [Myxococcota bacterium]